MIAVAATPLAIQVSVPKSPAYEGEWVPLVLILTRPSDADGAVQVRAVTCDDPDVQLDLDLLDRETPLRPGETYRLTMPLRASRPKVLGLGHLTVHVRPHRLELDDHGAEHEEPVPLPPTALAIRPAIGRHITVKIEPLCAYDDGTKVLLTLKHNGSTTFRDLTVNLLPPDAIRGGKPTIRRAEFQSNQEEQLELVVTGNEIDVVMTAIVDGEHTEARRTFAIGEPPRVGEQRFHFLEPRQLSTDVTAMFELSGETSTPVDSPQGIFAIHGGNQYHLIIRPQHSGVTSIDVRDIPGLIHKRDRQQLRDGGWRFLIDVSFSELLRKPEVIYYDVESRGEHLTGEVPVCLKPPWSRHIQVAGALGIALTVQGVAAIARFMHNADFDLTSVASEFKFRDDYNLFFLFSIPGALGLLKVVDWMQYRWRQ